MKKLTMIIAILMTANISSAQIINIPDDFPTIQQGIDAADEGDTILVQPGTYYENIIVSNKTFVLASLYLNTQDTAYISQTIIDGNLTGSCITMSHCNNGTKLSGFTLQYGLAQSGGGLFIQASSPNADHLIVRNNEASSYGGGIYVDYSNPTFEDVLIANNTASYGGGLYGMRYVTLKNVTVTGNDANMGGGIFFQKDWGFMYLENVSVMENYAGYVGGGIYSCPGMIMENGMISSNTSGESGGGVFLTSDPIEVAFLENVTICNNHSREGGGIFLESNNIQFNAIHKCNVYGNTALCTGSDFFIADHDKEVEIIVDTMSVLFPNDYHAEPVNSFSFDIQHGMTEQINADLYISPDGENQNSGLFPNEPLKNIRQAFSLILADKLHRNTIHLLEGTYSPSNNDEKFPLHCIDDIRISGTSASQVILDAEGSGPVIMLYSDTAVNISNMTLTGGESIDLRAGGGISCYYSDDILLESILVNDNTVTDMGGWGGHGGGVGICTSEVSLLNSLITNNACAYYGGGIYADGNSNVSILNVTLTGNESGYSGGSIYNESSSVILKNCISYFNVPDEIYNLWMPEYCNIKDNPWSGFDGNINEDPQFIGSGDHPYQLSAGSPCIEAGIPDTTGLNLPFYDLIGNFRLWDGDEDGETIVDMGAYEFGSLPVGTQNDKVRNLELEVQIYPNPVSETGTIEFELNETTIVSIQIYSTLGEKVYDLGNANFPEGKNRVIWSANHLPAGIYFCRLQIGNEVVTKIIIKVR
ncbi:MAG: T9SS type A sorting domain-containing protein [Lentimicrobium sp.]